MNRQSVEQYGSVERWGDVEHRRAHGADSVRTRSLGAHGKSFPPFPCAREPFLRTGSPPCARDEDGDEDGDWDEDWDPLGLGWGRDESLWGSDDIVSCYRFTESRTGEFAPETILCIFAELGRFGGLVGNAGA